MPSDETNNRSLSGIPQRVLIVDVLKVIGIILVVVHHVYGSAIPQLDTAGFLPRTVGALGVELFILASGIGLALSHPQINSWLEVKEFYSKRILRIYPAYWIAGILFALVIHSDWVNKSHSALDVFKIFSGFSTFGTAQWVNIANIDLNSTFWFITIILQMYMAFPLVLYAINKRPNISIVGFFLLTLSVKIIKLVVPSIPIASFWFLPFTIFGFALGIYLIKRSFYPKIQSNRLIAYLSNLSFFIYLVHAPLLGLRTNLPLFTISILIVSAALMAFDNSLRKKISQLSIKLSLGVKGINGRFNLNGTKQGNNIRNLHYGLFGGIAGIIAAGLLMRISTSCILDVWFPGLIICGALGGGFGLLTKGNPKIRGTTSCAFGILAILFGLMMTYSTPIVIGKVQILGSNIIEPVYKWHEISIIQFLLTQLADIKGIFFGFFGLFSAYSIGSRIDLRRAIMLKKNPNTTVQEMPHQSPTWIQEKR